MKYVPPHVFEGSKFPGAPFEFVIHHIQCRTLWGLPIVSFTAVIHIRGKVVLKILRTYCSDKKSLYDIMCQFDCVIQWFVCVQARKNLLSSIHFVGRFEALIYPTVFGGFTTIEMDRKFIFVPPNNVCRELSGTRTCNFILEDVSTNNITADVAHKKAKNLDW